MPKDAIWTPDGMVTLNGAAPSRVELKAGVMEWLRQFSDVAAHLGLGIHCAKCKADVIGKNADSDRVFSVACECREYVGVNRDWKSYARES